MAEGQPRHRDADHRVDEAKEDDVGPIRLEIFEASHQGVPEVDGLDAGHRGQWRTLALLASPQGTTQRCYGQSRKRDLIPSPLYGVSDMVLAGHHRTSRTSSTRAAGHPWLDANSAAGRERAATISNHTPIRSPRPLVTPSGHSAPRINTPAHTTTEPPKRYCGIRDGGAHSCSVGSKRHGK